MAPLRSTFNSTGADQKVELRYPRSVALENGEQVLEGIAKGENVDVALSDGSSTKARSGADSKPDLFTRDAMYTADIDLLHGGGDK
ncbi:MAG: hypothetical protein ACREWI_04925 [Telluria sp.]